MADVRANAGECFPFPTRLQDATPIETLTAARREVQAKIVPAGKQDFILAV
jgi:hypothetical protein